VESHADREYPGWLKLLELEGLRCMGRAPGGNNELSMLQTCWHLFPRNPSNVCVAFGTQSFQGRIAESGI
jgi:hypothetical protein